jgi:Rad3-related DNA helicase
MEALRILSSVKHRISFKSPYIKLFSFLALLPKVLHLRNLLVLDEAHRLEEEIVKFTEISISKRR